jgi:hypothetical protein
MYSLNMPVSALRTKMRQEFERHRYVKQISVVDMLIFQSHAEYQVCGISPSLPRPCGKLGWHARFGTKKYINWMAIDALEFIGLAEVC